MSFLRTAVLAAAILNLGACTREQAKETANAASPLIGTWTRDGDMPSPSTDRPQFTKLAFNTDGTVTASYVAAGGALAGVIKKAPKVQQEDDTYSVVDSKTVRIAEGSSARNYSYDVHGGKLYLTPPDGSTATVFSKIDS